ncbi:MAG: LemA family protein [Candidatus Diapherotrites archaeon]|uniref:LemA family protein n=1 Tax=Candidatus Iainarchaeum sp. TaxID=3101447 RepID=A0A8T4LGR1_9ARCH|nr:LemA family protein [Candidatus Diapherotrites archaeon]
MVLMLIAGLLVVAALAVVLVYNGLVTVRNRVDNAWSQIDVQLKRRTDLIPNLVETVKGYMTHERQTLEAVTNARAALVKAGSVADKAQADNMLTQALKTVFAVAESYPDLKANQNFMLLQEELAGTESKIAYARQFYNDSVLGYNNSIQTVPSNIVADMFGFKAKDFFQIPEGERAAVKVSF